jgi:uncharacterized protein (UPF0333 family)
MNRLITVSAIVFIALAMIEATTIMTYGQKEVVIMKTPRARLGAIDSSPDAPIAISGENTYIAWWTNKTGNDEVNFRASTDGGQTFGDKINISNSTGAESQDVEIAADGDNVIITWWERNATSEEPVARISSDNGATFGLLLKLASNGTIGEAPQ